MAKASRVRVNFDGGLRNDQAAYGWVLQISNTEDCTGRQEWQEVASASVPLAAGVTVPQAELTAASEATKAMLAFTAGHLVLSAEARVLWPFPAVWRGS